MMKQYIESYFKKPSITTVVTEAYQYDIGYMQFCRARGGPCALMCPVFLPRQIGALDPPSDNPYQTPALLCNSF